MLNHKYWIITHLSIVPTNHLKDFRKCCTWVIHLILIFYERSCTMIVAWMQKFEISLWPLRYCFHTTTVAIKFILFTVRINCYIDFGKNVILSRRNVCVHFPEDKTCNRSCNLHLYFSWFLEVLSTDSYINLC